MDDIDIDLVRVLVKQLCKPSTHDGGWSHDAVFDWGEAPGYEGERERVRALNELLVAKGVARVGRINMKNRPGFAVLEPTEEGMTWCRYAHDDQQWEQHRERLKELLTTP